MTKKIYLAGKILPEVRAAIYDGLRDLDVELMDPTKKPYSPAIADFVLWDLDHVRIAHAIVVIDVADFQMKGTMAEVGAAYAWGVPILTVVHGGFIHPFLAALSRVVTFDIDTLIKYLRTWIDTDDFVKAYYSIYED